MSEKTERVTVCGMTWRRDAASWSRRHSDEFPGLVWARGDEPRMLDRIAELEADARRWRAFKATASYMYEAPGSPTGYWYSGPVVTFDHTPTPDEWIDAATRDMAAEGAS